MMKGVRLAIGQITVGRLAMVRIIGEWYRRRPFLVAWALLALGMAVVVVVFGRDTGLTLTQHAILTVLAVPLAGACTWIARLEDGSAESTADGPG